MKFTNYLEEKIFFILFQISFIFLISFFLFLVNVEVSFILMFLIVMIVFIFSYLYIMYNFTKKKSLKIMDLIDSLDEKYLISEIITKPSSIENSSYYYALKKACKSMNDKISKFEKDKLNYREYVESFAHEIKTPISSLALYFYNTNNLEMKQETEKINNLVEQMLFYARSDNTEKDYFVKDIKLADLSHNVIISYKPYLLRDNIIIKTSNLEEVVYTDEKWLNFILSQVIQNCIKYFDKETKIIEITSLKNENNLVLSIKDNGCGIKSEDLVRICEKAFTGNNRKKEHSTGMGLYLCKKLCNNMGLEFNVDSIEKESTTVSITFPKSNICEFKSNEYISRDDDISVVAEMGKN